MFDETARAAGKLDGAGFFGWALWCGQPTLALAFERWDDTRRLSSPGDPERTNDLVAVLRHTDRPERVAHLLVELQTEPERHILYRLGGYALQLSREVSAALAPEDAQAVGAVLINLTGETPESGLALAAGGSELFVKPVVVNLCREVAAATLADIDAGLLGLCILPWLPLMAGGGEPALIEQWKGIAQREPDAQRRVAYRDFALVFAELTRTFINWQRGLEGWEMKESQYIKGWMEKGEQKGRLETRRALLLEALRERFQAPEPEAIRLAVEGTNDAAILDKWFKVALHAATLAEFTAAMKQGT